MTGAGQGALVQFGTLTAVKRASKVELIDSAGDRIAVVQFSNYDYENAGALAEERANTIVTVCNSHDALLREVEGLRKQVAAMQAVVNAASLWEAADANNEDGDDDSDEGYETALALCDAIEAYRAALSPASVGV